MIERLHTMWEWTLRVGFFSFGVFSLSNVIQTSFLESGNHIMTAVMIILVFCGYSHEKNKEIEALQKKVDRLRGTS